MIHYHYIAPCPTNVQQIWIVLDIFFEKFINYGQKNVKVVKRKTSETVLAMVQAVCYNKKKRKQVPQWLL